MLAVDIARLVAALAVMVFHLGYGSWALPGSTPATIVQGAAAYPEIAPASFWGRFGVEVFFVISGFVIAFSASRSTPWRFLRSRVLRLLPAVLICATAALIVAKAIGWQSDEWLIAAYLRSIAFSLYGPWIDGSYWTLGVEVCFYAVVFCLLWARRFAWLEPVAVGLGLVSTCYWLWALAASNGLLPLPALPLSDRDQILIIRFGTTFGVGVVAWAALEKGWHGTRIAALLALILGTLVNIYMSAPNYMSAVGAIYRPLPAVMWLVIVGLMWLGIRFDSGIRSRLGDPAARLIRFLGLSTYPLYLLHQVVGAATLSGLLGLGIAPYPALLLSMAGMVGLAALVTATAEPVVRRGLAALLDWRPVRRTAAPR